MSNVAWGVLLDRVGPGGGNGGPHRLAKGYAAVPGIANVQVWTAQDPAQGHLITCDVRDPGLLGDPARLDGPGSQPPPWTGERFWTGRQILPGDAAAAVGAGALYTVYMDAPPGLDGEFNDWYNTEHVPRLAAVPGCLQARRFAAAAGSPAYLALYSLAELPVVENDAWEQAALTPWRHRVISRTRNRHKVLYLPYPA